MHKAIQFTFLVAVCMTSTGCVTPAQLQSLSAGQTGCVPDAIAVSEPKPITGGFMWNATCTGKKYLCTVIQSGKNADQASCAVAAQ
jgi:hypothetical protein